MHNTKLIDWVMGVVMVGGAMTVTPVNAQTVFTDDFSGTNVFDSSPIVPYGLGPLEQSPIVPAIDGLVDSINSLTDANSTVISADTKTSLQALAEHVNGLKTKPSRAKGELDQPIREVATNLSRDVAAAEAACSTSGGAACEQLSNLVAATGVFLDNIEQLRTALVEHARFARIY